MRGLSYLKHIIFMDEPVEAAINERFGSIEQLYMQLFEPGWFTSSMGRLYLYSFKNGKWEIITSVTHRTNGEPLLPNLIKKGRHYYLRGTIFTEDDKPYDERIKFRK